MLVKRNKTKFAIRVQNEGAEDLEVTKVYRVFPDARAAKDRYFKIIDESGEDYLYPAGYFVALELLPEAERALSVATH